MVSTSFANEQENDLKMIYPNTWVILIFFHFFLFDKYIQGSINEQKIIVDEDDVDNLLLESDDNILREKLIRSHDLSKKVHATSNMTVHRIVSLQIRVKKLPYQY